jgi:hypothetical protein
MNKLLGTVVLAACMAVVAPGAGASVSSQQQGMHQWPALKGRLILINGTYQDVLKYERSLTFYFESKPGADWLHVPVITSATDQPLTWFSASVGEQTLADAVVVAVPGGIELVVASTRPGDPAPITVRWYRLTESDDGHPDDPAYFFKKISSTSYPASAKLTVEQVLKREVAAKSRK